MKNPTILIPTTKICLINALPINEQDAARRFSKNCSIRWKLSKLLVSSNSFSDNPHSERSSIIALENFEWSIRCLVKSSVHAVCVDRNLESSALSIWANVCSRSKRPLYIRLKALQGLPQNSLQVVWHLKRCIDILTALIVLLFTAPIFFMIVFILSLRKKRAIFSKKYYVGQRGKVIQLYRFNTAESDLEFPQNSLLNSGTYGSKLNKFSFSRRFELYLRKSRIENFPLLLNALFGELSIIGPEPIKLTDISVVDPNSIFHLRELPGIIFSQRAMIDTVSEYKYRNRYFSNNWSIYEDLKVLFEFFVGSH